MQFLDTLYSLASPRWPWFAGLGVFFLLGDLVFFSGQRSAQPLAFNHAKHIGSGMACTDCHAGARQQAHATLPPLATCLTCHESALTPSAEEAKIRKAAAAGTELAWIQLTRVPAHVYFSHRRHVEMAKIECAVCHGPMETATTPPRSLFRRLNMDDCIQCHQQNRARTDCNDCHR